MLEIDHIVISAETLEEGTAYVTECLGVDLLEGGQHAKFGTHNRLLRLGDIYLEVIAIDPSAAKPDCARWFGLDEFSGQPRITNWVCRTDKPRRVIGRTLPGTGEMVPVSRGDLHWQITVARNGKLPLDGFAPAIIDWMGADAPPTRMPESGCTVNQFSIMHPHAITLRSFLSGLLSDDRLTLRGSEVPKYELTLKTPSGPKILT